SPDFQSARSPDREDVALRHLVDRRVPRRHERVQRREPRGHTVRLPLPGHGTGARRADHPRRRSQSPMVTRASWLWVLLCAACDTGFQKQSIVVDLRVLAIRSDPAEVVVDVDPADLTNLQLPAVVFTALVGDPLGPRSLAYTFTACPVTDSLRCDEPGDPTRRFADTTTDDVDASPPTATLAVDLELLQAALAADKFHGLGGIPVQVEMVIRPAGAPDDQAVFAS